MSLLNKVLHTEKTLPDHIVRTKASHNTPAAATEPPTRPHFRLSIELESPPIVLYGSAAESSGSIVSGLLFLSALENSTVEIESVSLSLVQTIRLTKPFHIASSTVASCKKCTNRQNILARWDIVTASTQFSPGNHAYPFSHLLPGSLPASSKLGSSSTVSFVKYDLIAVARLKDSPQEIKVDLPLNVHRSILRGPDRNSLRVFPPTEVSASAVLPNVVHPKSTFPVELKLENMVTASGDRRWRMRKLIWKIQESTKVRAYCCEKHSSKLKAVQESQVKVALAKELKGGPPQKTASSANSHYSNIITEISLGPANPNVEVTQAPTDESATGINGAPVVALDTSEVERNAPSHANDNFLEDFGSPLIPASSNEASRTAGSTPSLGPGNNNSPNSVSEQQVYFSEKRTISHGELKSGWKSDFSGRGKIELVAEINAMGLSTGLTKHVPKYSSTDPSQDETRIGLRNGANFSCDIDDPNEGIFVSHLLLVEIVVAEETITAQKRPKGKPGNTLTPVASASSVKSNAETASPVSAPVGVPTGAARVLRMQFKLNMTERSGLGISWDDEVPPTYTDVSTFSPPTYSESSAASTPPSAPLSALSRPTTRILCGVGDTPGMTVLPETTIDSALDLEDRIQDLTI